VGEIEGLQVTQMSMDSFPVARGLANKRLKRAI